MSQRGHGFPLERVFKRQREDGTRRCLSKTIVPAVGARSRVLIPADSVKAEKEETRNDSNERAGGLGNRASNESLSRRVHRLAGTHCARVPPRLP